MRRHAGSGIILSILVCAVMVITAQASDKVVTIRPVPTADSLDNRVAYRCLTCEGLSHGVNDPVNAHGQRSDRFSLPSSALAPDFDSTINCLVLRFNFQYEDTDDANTTGRGEMDVSRPLDNPTDSAEYYNRVGHWIDPPPHDSAYYHAHLRALSTYWEFVSEDRIGLNWDIFPKGAAATYTLPGPMSEYGACSNLSSEIIAGLEKYFIDCIQLADTAHLIDSSLYPDIDFSQYQAIFLFHAGSDRQNDIGFPETCSDLFTGFIRFGDSLAVDNGATYVRTALMMPETASQDNRATALNAVMAHEFGHQLGLVDLYATRNFRSQLGDFALMDNNGFGSGVDFGFATGNVFGTVPLYPCAWSRAYLGFNEVQDFRAGDNIRLSAAEVASSGHKVARVPISEKEYYLLECRVANFVPDADNIQRLRVDSASNVILGPADSNRVLTGEYDALMPGDGMLIFHVDESVAGMDFDNDGVNNFDDNQLQNVADQRFIKLVEADGIVNFGGYYRSGFGSEDDMFRDDRATSFTPNTNPQTIDNTGNNTNIYITDIKRDSMSFLGDYIKLDTAMFFSVETDKLVQNFPVRCKLPAFGLTPVVDDVDGDGTDDIIVASDNRLFVFTTTGESVIRKITGTDIIFFDVIGSTVNPGVQYVVPMYAQMSASITAGPVTGDFGTGSSTRIVAVGYPSGGGGRVAMFEPTDGDNNGQADGVSFTTVGTPIALSFGERFYALTDAGMVYWIDSLNQTTPESISLPADEYHGMCRMNNALILMSGDSLTTSLTFIGDVDDTTVFDLGDYYQFGPVMADVDRDGTPEVAAFSDDGRAILVSLRTMPLPATFEVFAEAETGYTFTANPAVGDVDRDGYPDLIVAGENILCALNRELRLVTGYPKEINDRFPTDAVIAGPIVADLESGGAPETVFPTNVGNIYSFGEQETFGFPLSGGEKGAGSCVYYTDSTGGYLGYLGADGWFYAWEVNADEESDYWPMGGGDPEGSFAFDNAKLGATAALSESFDEQRFYNYPNPVTTGETTFRYYLGTEPTSVTLTVYDFSGAEIASLEGSREAGIDNEIVWNCDDVTPGVYRCIINVRYDGSDKTAFTDVAVIR